MFRQLATPSDPDGRFQRGSRRRLSKVQGRWSEIAENTKLEELGELADLAREAEPGETEALLSAADRVREIGLSLAEKLDDSELADLDSLLPRLERLQ